MRPILFIDRDGTIVHETEDEKVDRIDKLSFLPEALYYLRKIHDELPYLLVMVTNQDGLGTPDFPEEEFWPVHEFIMRTLDSEGIHFAAVHIDDHWPEDEHPNRKPGTGMLQDYLTGEHDIESSYVIGDRVTDVTLARNLGCKAIHIFPAEITDAELTTDSWKNIYEYLKAENTA
jgi:imidazoleglycerol-phosphate dehydratase/histidinol-phosphatase